MWNEFKNDPDHLVFFVLIFGGLTLVLVNMIH